MLDNVICCCFVCRKVIVCCGLCFDHVAGVLLSEHEVEVVGVVVLSVLLWFVLVVWLWRLVVVHLLVLVLNGRVVVIIDLVENIL